MRKNKFLAVVKQEFKMASRSKYIIISFILLPLIMWGFQGGIQYFVASIITEDQVGGFEGEVINIVNNDLGNGSVNYGELLIQGLKDQTINNETEMYKVDIDETYKDLNYDELIKLTETGENYPFILIPQNFTQSITNFSETFTPARVYIVYHPSYEEFTWSIQYGVYLVTREKPFTIHNIEYASATEFFTVSYEGEESASNPFASGFLSYIIIILTVMAPSPYVSSAFAGEREKRTLESLLVLPMKKLDIFSAKIVAGLGILLIFTFFNVIGVIIYGEIMKYNAKVYEDEMYNVDISGTMIISIILMILLTSFVALSIGISIASFMKNTQNAEGLYVAVMLFPAVIVGMITLMGSMPTGLTWIYIIPWMHSIAILNKGMYPSTYANSTITGAIWLDMLFHLGVLLLFALASLVIASKLFSRESIINN